MCRACIVLWVQVGVTDLPEALPEIASLNKETHKALLQKLHEVLVEVTFKALSQNTCRCHGSCPQCLCVGVDCPCARVDVGQIHVQEGSLRCDKCGRSYPIQQGIPNMRLNEDEVQ
jgi:uncharacterized protein YbaR (Trm112 family)